MARAGSTTSTGYGVPETQRAVQLVGPDELRLNPAKPVFAPGPHQVLCRVEAVGLCFSDLKLLAQFSRHPRKSEITSGVEPRVLTEIPSYAPGTAPTVPGHEASVRVHAVGEGVIRFKPGERYLVQTDYRWLPTAGSNASFGYNFEGALQEYVLMDERIITSPEGESMLIPASEKLSASAVGLIEPWACVEDAYAAGERQGLGTGGRMLVVADAQALPGSLGRLLARYGRPAEITWISQAAPPDELGPGVGRARRLDDPEPAAYDDVVYLGSLPETVERLFPLAAAHGLVNIALCGGRLGRPVATAVGRVHYGGIRIVGTPGSDPAESMATIPATGELRAGDRVHIVGAAGPMGAMHVIRDLCEGVPGVSVLASDTDDERLAALGRLTRPLAETNGVAFETCNPSHGRPRGPFGYTVVMVPAPALVVQAVEDAAEGGIVNVFAGIPADVTADLDLDAYIRKRLYLIGTSGSVLEDMRKVLAKVEAGTLDTNLSVAAISGLEGAADGLQATRDRRIAGKIVVYPSCAGLGLVTIEDLAGRLPRVAEGLTNSIWSLAAERALLGMDWPEER